jgi:hypothetical protein
MKAVSRGAALLRAEYLALLEGEWARRHDTPELAEEARLRFYMRLDEMAARRRAVCGEIVPSLEQLRERQRDLDEYFKTRRR